MIVYGDEFGNIKLVNIIPSFIFSPTAQSFSSSNSINKESIFPSPDTISYRYIDNFSCTIVIRKLNSNLNQSITFSFACATSKLNLLPFNFLISPDEEKILIFYQNTTIISYNLFNIYSNKIINIESLTSNNSADMPLSSWI
jgi:hypothetical protein